MRESCASSARRRRELDRWERRSPRRATREDERKRGKASKERLATMCRSGVPNCGKGSKTMEAVPRGSRCGSPLSPKIDGSKTIGVRGRRRWSSRMSCGPRGRSSSIQVLVSDGEDRRRLETSRSRRAFLYTGRSAALVRCGEAHRQRRSPRLQKFLTDPGPCQSCAPVTDQGGERGATSESAEASWRVLESKIGRRASPGASMRWLVHTPDMYTMTAKG